MCDLETIVGCVPSLLAFMRCHSDHFRCHMTYFDLFMLFSMFACLYWTDCYIDRLAMCSPYYSILTRCIPDPFRPSLAFCCLYLSSQLSIFRCFGYLEFLLIALLL